MELFQTVSELAQAWGPSGNEGPAAELALSMLRKFCPDFIFNIYHKTKIKLGLIPPD